MSSWDNTFRNLWGQRRDGAKGENAYRKGAREFKEVGLVDTQLRNRNKTVKTLVGNIEKLGG